MKKELFFVIVLCAAVIAEEITGNSDDDKEVGRRRKIRFPFHHGLGGYGFGLPALAILYWVKVKLIVIAFAVGMAFVWGFKYFWPHKSCPEVIHEGPIIPYESSFPSWSDHHHHHPPSGYSAHPDEHSYPGPDPYSAWSSYSEVSPESVVSATSYPYKRESKGRQISNENQISDVVFSFLGVGSEACRKRFLCELEFRSRLNPLTELAFNVFGQRIFSQYIQKSDDEKYAKSFAECAEVHNECEFIEEDIPETEVEEESQSTLTNSSVDAENHLENSANIDTSSIPERKRRDIVAEAILARPLPIK